MSKDKTTEILPVNVKKLIISESGNLESAVRAAMSGYFARAGDQFDEVSITVIVGNGGCQGISDVFSVDLERYQINTEKQK